MSKYKKGDILLYNRTDLNNFYFYVKQVNDVEYVLGKLNTYEYSSYPFRIIDNNGGISLSLKQMLKEL